MDYKNVWSVSDIIKNKNNWNLLADSELLKHLQYLSENILSKSKSTLSLIDSFENEVNDAVLTVSNLNNRFKSLSDTQFIENKVEESPEAEAVDVGEIKEKEEAKAENVSIKLKKALENGLSVLQTHYNVITVSDSESENDEPQEILLKSCNPFMKRRLPYIIGTDDFAKYDHLGLIDSSSEEEEEIESEEDVEQEPSYLKVPKIAENNIFKSQTQIIQISSSDSEDSEVSVSKNDQLDVNGISKKIIPDSHVESSPPALKTHAPFSFADHLNSTLQNAGAHRPAVIERIVDSFSPPPFPSKNDSDFSSDEEKSDSSDSIYKCGPVKDTSRASFVPVDNNDDFSVVTTAKNQSDAVLKKSQLSKSEKSEEKNITNQTDQSLPSPAVSSISVRSRANDTQISRALADELKRKFRSYKSSSSNSSIDEADEPESSISHATASETSTRDKHNENKLPISRQTESASVSDECSDGNDSDDWCNRVVSSQTSRNSISASVDRAESLDNPRVNIKSDKVVAPEAPRIVKSKPLASNPAEFSVFGEVGNDLNEKPVFGNSSVATTSISSAKVKLTDASFACDKIETGELDTRQSGSLSNNDDDVDELFTRKKSAVSDEYKTSDFYKMLFEDSESEDPIKALVEENKQRMKTQKTQDETEVSKMGDLKRNEKSDENRSISQIMSLPEKKEKGDQRVNVEGTSKVFMSDEWSALKFSANNNNHVAEKIKQDNDLFYGIEQTSLFAAVKDTKVIGPVEKKEVAEYVTDSEFGSRTNKLNRSPLDVRISNVIDQAYNFQKPSLATNEIPDMTVKLGFSEISTVNLRSDIPEKSAAIHSKVDIPVPIDDSSVIMQSNSDIDDACMARSNAKNTEYLKSTSGGRQEKEAYPQNGPFIRDDDFGSEFSGLATANEDMTNQSIIKEQSTVEAHPSMANAALLHQDTTIENDGDSMKKEILASKIPLPREIMPGKLAVGRGANINVNALLPSSGWSTVSKKQEECNKSKKFTPAMKANVSDPVSEPEPVGLLCVTKDRAKIPTKRRLPSRRARTNPVTGQNIFFDTTIPTNDQKKSNNNGFLASESASFNASIVEKSNFMVENNVANVTDEVVGLSPEKRFQSSVESNPSRVIAKKTSGKVESCPDDARTEYVFSDSDNIKSEIKSTASMDNLGDFPETVNRAVVFNESKNSISKQREEIRKRNESHNFSSQTVSTTSPQMAPFPNLDDDDVNPKILDVVERKDKYENPKSTLSDNIRQTAPSERNSLFSVSIQDNKSSFEEIKEPTESLKCNKSSKNDLFDNSSDESDTLMNVTKTATLRKMIKNVTQPSLVSDSSIDKATGQINNSMKRAKAETFVPKTSLFTDDSEDEQFFSAIKKPLSKGLTSKKGSLFDDSDDDDNNLFGGKASRNIQNNSAKAKKSSPVEKQRAVKLHCEIAFDDPLARK